MIKQDCIIIDLPDLKMELRKIYETIILDNIKDYINIGTNNQIVDMVISGGFDMTWNFFQNQKFRGFASTSNIQTTFEDFVAPLTDSIFQEDHVSAIIIIRKEDSSHYTTILSKRE